MFEYPIPFLYCLPIVPSSLLLSSFQPENRVLTGALIFSVLTHIALIAIHFSTPPSIRPKTANSPIEVMLVNAKSNSKPVKADALAQVNLNGGGEHDRNEGSTPQPPTPIAEPSDAFMVAQRRLQALEEEQKKLLRDIKQNLHKVRPVLPSDNTPQAEQTPNHGFDPIDSIKQIANQLSVIENSINDYNKRPRRHYFSPTTSEYKYTQYVEDWRRKIEQVGNLNYPAAARGKLYGSLRLTVYIRSDGTLENIDMDKPSKHAVLNNAAENIVRMAAPFARFPPELAKETDVLVISRTWIFTNDTLGSSVQ